MVLAGVAYRKALKPGWPRALWGQSVGGQEAGEVGDGPGRQGHNNPKQAVAAKAPHVGGWWPVYKRELCLRWVVISDLLDVVV